ncbi:unnamed protein product [Auanema sp. JU1783]|nr:unnamed protein product [Auanema sp. JU1783]
MFFLKSLLFFRCLFIGSLFLFIYRLYKEYTIETDFVNQILPQSFLPTILWSSIDIENPERLHNPLAERLRLNELFASKQIECKNSLRIADSRQTFVICPEIHNNFETGLTITGNSFSNGDIEAQLNISKWTVFLPEDSTIIDNLLGDVEVNYFTELSSWDHWHTWDMEQAVKGKTFSFMKFELYTPYFENYDQPSVIRKLLKLLKMPANYMLITIHVPPDDNDKGKRVLSEWYRLFYWLFFEKDYAISGAYPSGSCGFQSQSCRYHISLVNHKGFPTLTAPVFGLGSPIEEKKRLISEMSTRKDNCFVIKSEDFPHFCARNLLKDSQVVLIRYGKLTVPNIPEVLQKIDKIHLVQPEHLSNLPHNVNHIRVGVAINKAEESPDQSWRLESLEKILNKQNISRIDLLLVDTQGAEWDIIPDMVYLLQKKKHQIQQIALKGVIYPEENENYRKFYWYLREIRTMGFSKAFGTCVNDNFHLGYTYSL